VSSHGLENDELHPQVARRALDQPRERAAPFNHPDWLFEPKFDWLPLAAN